MSRIRSAWKRFWFAEVPVYPLVLARIGLGLTLFLFYLSMVPELDLLLGLEGVVQQLTERRILFSQSLDSAHRIAVGAALIGALSFILGIYGRAGGLVLFLAHLWLRPLTDAFTWGWTTVIGAFVLYIVLSGAGTSIGIRRTRQPQPGARSCTAWPLRLCQIHICTIYLSAAWSRIGNADWISGEKLELALGIAELGRMSSLPWDAIAPLLRVGLWGSWGLELLAPIALWVPRTRRVWVLGLMGMHLLLELCITVGWWQFLMLSVLVVFLPDGWCERLTRRLRVG